MQVSQEGQRWRKCCKEELRKGCNKLEHDKLIKPAKASQGRA
jgi:hypothetical protein